MDLTEHIKHAKRIRARLLRTARWEHRPSLRNGCGIASGLLAEATGDLGSLRLGRTYNRQGWHAWNVFGDTIIDITASQFNLLQRCALNVQGILVTKIPRHYHEDLYHTGSAVIRHMNGYCWYGAGRPTSSAWNRAWQRLCRRLDSTHGGILVG